MKIKSIIFGSLVVSAGCFNSCKMDPIGIMNTGSYADTTGVLKDATAITIGFGIDYASFMNKAAYKNIVAREGSSVTFGYEMKHGAIVKNDGSLDFTNADALYSAVTSAGLQVFGHTLAWYSNQNANYLKSYAKILIPASAELLVNPGFETAGSGKIFANWSDLNHTYGTFTAGTGASNVHAGSGSLVATVATSASSWRMQYLSDAVPVSSSKKYTISYWIKAATACSIQFELRNNDAGNTVQYVGGQPATTSWTMVSYTYTPLASTLAIAFDLGAVATTYYIDDVSIKEVLPAPDPANIPLYLDTALNKFITGTVTHYAGKVKAWDVVNELFSDNGSIRNNDNTPTPSGNTDYLVWSQYMGKSFGVKAFKYAKAADANALLFINDYGLENNFGTGKIDSLVAYLGYLKANGAQVDGVGTQLHITINSSYAGIDLVFQKLAATGLKVRISELDVRLNPTDKTYAGAYMNSNSLSSQADMYKYVIESYIRNVPAAQRYGITIWGVDDPNSWIIINQKKADAPLLFDANFAKKPAYSAVLEALKGS